jgi:ABC-type antimicrobial peptide transport system permease subunit
MALPLPRLFGAIFEGLHFESPGLYLVVLAAMLMVAAFTIYMPARRATRVDPMAALRDQ